MSITLTTVILFAVFGVLLFLGVPIFACLQVLVRWLLNTRLEKRHMPLQAWEYVRRDRQETPPPYR